MLVWRGHSQIQFHSHNLAPITISALIFLVAILIYAIYLYREYRLGRATYAALRSFSPPQPQDEEGVYESPNSLWDEIPYNPTTERIAREEQPKSRVSTISGLYAKVQKKSVRSIQFFNPNFESRTNGESRHPEVQGECIEMRELNSTSAPSSSNRPITIPSVNYAKLISKI